MISKSFFLPKIITNYEITSQPNAPVFGLDPSAKVFSTSPSKLLVRWLLLSASSLVSPFAVLPLWLWGSIRVYLVVVDIRIVDCYMYSGESCPPSHVLLYIPADASIQSINYTNSIPPTVKLVLTPCSPWQHQHGNILQCWCFHTFIPIVPILVTKSIWWSWHSLVASCSHSLSALFYGIHSIMHH